MLSVRRSTDRGTAQLGWLESRHTFSFADYRDERFMGFGPLRVINEDRVQPGRGFDSHSHRDMEILSYVIEGALEHRDSLGNGSIIRPGELQLMRAGTGVTHSEYNHSRTDLVHFLQIWVLPDQGGLEPAYEQIALPAEDRRGRLRLAASPDGAGGSLRIHQNVSVFATLLEADESVTHAFAPTERGWLQIVRGGLRVNGRLLEAGDGAALSEESVLEIVATSSAEALLFVLA